MSNAPAPRDYAGEYLAARMESRRRTATLARRANAQDAAARIARAAERAGVQLDEITLDEQARAALYG